MNKKKKTYEPVNEKPTSLTAFKELVRHEYSKDDAVTLQRAVESIPEQFRGAFIRFVKDGETNPEFDRFLDQNKQCRDLCEYIIQTDQWALVALLALRLVSRSQNKV